MPLQQCAECLGLLYPRKHPQRMPKNAPVFLVGERITAILVLLGQQVEESGNILFVDKAAVLVHTEELTEIECHVLIDKFFQ